MLRPTCHADGCGIRRFKPSFLRTLLKPNVLLLVSGVLHSDGANPGTAKRQSEMPPHSGAALRCSAVQCEGVAAPHLSVRHCSPECPRVVSKYWWKAAAPVRWRVLPRAAAQDSLAAAIPMSWVTLNEVTVGRWPVRRHSERHGCPPPASHPTTTRAGTEVPPLDASSTTSANVASDTLHLVRGRRTTYARESVCAGGRMDGCTHTHTK